MLVTFADTNFKLPAQFKREYTARITRAYAEVSKLLPFGPKHMTFMVRPRATHLVEGARNSATTHSSELIELAFSPEIAKTETEVLLSDVRGTVFHEMVHAAQFELGIYSSGFLNGCVGEGLATAFARDYAAYKAPWAEYPNTVRQWLQEIIDCEPTIDWRQYMFNHPDGRRWIGYRTGTYIIDEALKKSGQTLLELMQMQQYEIVRWAELPAQHSYVDGSLFYARACQTIIDQARPDPKDMAIAIDQLKEPADLHPFLDQVPQLVESIVEEYEYDSDITDVDKAWEKLKEIVAAFLRFEWPPTRLTLLATYGKHHGGKAEQGFSAAVERHKGKLHVASGSTQLLTMINKVATEVNDDQTDEWFLRNLAARLPRSHAGLTFWNISVSERVQRD